MEFNFKEFFSVKDFFTPLIKIILIGGFVLTISYYVIRAFYNVWTKQVKFFLKYKIMRKKYPEKTVVWCFKAIEQGIGWYDVKKTLMIKGIRKGTINETLYIYDQILKELNKSQGGIQNGRKYKRSYSKDEKQSTELPSF